jgi:hypothetical protein
MLLQDAMEGGEGGEGGAGCPLRAALLSAEGKERQLDGAVCVRVRVCVMDGAVCDASLPPLCAH